MPLALPKFSPHRNGEFSLYRKLYATEIKVDYSTRTFTDWPLRCMIVLPHVTERAHWQCRLGPSSEVDDIAVHGRRAEGSQNGKTVECTCQWPGSYSEGERSPLPTVACLCSCFKKRTVNQGTGQLIFLLFFFFFEGRGLIFNFFPWPRRLAKDFENEMKWKLFLVAWGKDFFHLAKRSGLLKIEQVINFLFTSSW